MYNTCWRCITYWRCITCWT